MNQTGSLLTYSFPAHRSSSCGSKAKVVTGVEGALGEGPGRGILAAYSETMPMSALRTDGYGQTNGSDHTSFQSASISPGLWHGGDRVHGSGLGG
jgi:hypothetical protein